MAKNGKMVATDKEGVRAYTSADGQLTTYYIRVMDNGRKRDIKVGTSADRITPARAARIRSKIIRGELPIPQDERRKQRAARARQKRTVEGRLTFGQLWALWLKEKGDYNRLTNDTSHWNWRLKKRFENLTPAELKPAVLIRYKSDLEKMLTVPIGPFMKLEAAKKLGDKKLIAAAKKNYESKREPLAYGTQYQVIGLLRRLTLWAFERELAPAVFIKWNISQPKKKAADELTREQIQKLIEVCEKSRHAAGSMVLLALYTGARRTEIINLKWSDIDFDFNTIKLGVNQATMTTKDGQATNRVPMNSYALTVLKKIPQLSKTWVFPSPQTGAPYKNPSKALAKIKRAANLPPEFRIMHGCRHVYASHVGVVANSIAVKELLTHKDMETAEKYVHTPPEYLRDASQKAAALYHQAAGGKVIDLEQKRTA